MKVTTAMIGIANVGNALDELVDPLLLLLTPSTTGREGNEVGNDGE